MDVDIILEPDLTPTQVAELGRKAESYGIRAVWSSNYFAHWDCFLSLVPLAQSTSKILLGPLAVSPFEMHPLKIANSLLSLNEMCDGRAVIAMLDQLQADFGVEMEIDKGIPLSSGLGGSAASAVASATRRRAIRPASP